MKPLYDTSAPNELLKLSVNSDLLKKSSALNLNLSTALEIALSPRLLEHTREQWVENNRSAIELFIEFVEANGCFGDEYRNF